MIQSLFRRTENCLVQARISFIWTKHLLIYSWKCKYFFSVHIQRNSTCIVTMESETEWEKNVCRFCVIFVCFLCGENRFEWKIETFFLLLFLSVVFIFLSILPSLGFARQPKLIVDHEIYFFFVSSSFLWFSETISEILSKENNISMEYIWNEEWNEKCEWSLCMCMAWIKIYGCAHSTWFHILFFFFQFPALLFVKYNLVLVYVKWVALCRCVFASIEEEWCVSGLPK